MSGLKIAEVGDVVRPNDGVARLRSGSSEYGGAIVLSIDPFVLVSEHGDMRWQCTVSIDDFHVAGKVTTEHLDKVKHRLDK